MKNQSKQRMNSNDDVQMRRAQGAMRELSLEQLKDVHGAGAGSSLSWRAFNPQPEPPNPKYLFGSMFR